VYVRPGAIDLASRECQSPRPALLPNQSACCLLAGPLDESIHRSMFLGCVLQARSQRGPRGCHSRRDPGARDLHRGCGARGAPPRGTHQRADSAGEVRGEDEAASPAPGAHGSITASCH
jgi:hypothetical protein